MLDYMPGHIRGNLKVYQDPISTLEMESLNIGSYIRVSTSKESQKSSIENQKKILQEWARINNYNHVKSYIDIRTGAYKNSRIQLNEMLEDIKNGVIMGVIVKEVSRTSRDVNDMLQIKREIAFYGGFIAAIKEGYDSRADSDEFFLILHSAMAQKERKNTSSRVKLTQLVKAREGKTNVPLPAYGYKLGEDKATLVSNPETAEVLKLIFTKFVEEGWGQLKITKYLNGQGIKTRRGAKWSTNAVKTILTNPVYIGATCYNMTRLIRKPDGTQERFIRPEHEWIIVENSHEPLISIDMFERAQAIIAKRRENDNREWSADRKYLGSGILHCGICGGKVYGARYFRYRCDGRNGQCESSMKYWNMQELDSVLIELFKTIFEDQDKLRQTIEKQTAKDNYDPTLIQEQDLLRKRIEDIEKAKKRQQMAFENEAIELEEYRLRMAELRDEYQRILDKYNKISEKRSKTENLIAKFEKIYISVREVLQNLENLPIGMKAELINNTFEKVYIQSDYGIDQIVYRN
jgi:DNA invertase Pin-like site-specific DNA recombinase